MRGGCYATRRFYHAFYRWSVVNTPPSGCRALSTAPSRHVQEEASAQTVGIGRTTRGERHATRRLDLSSQRPSGNRSSPRPSPMTAKLMRGPVLTSTEKPFDTLAEWEEVVRYRSEAGMLLQLAVPGPNVRDAQSFYGQRLEKLRDKFGARLEVGSTSQHSGSEITSVTLSGTFLQVGRSRDALMAYKPPSWMGQSPRSEAEVPSRSLSAWEPILRVSAKEYRKIEMVVPSQQLAQINRVVPVLAQRQGVRIDMPSEQNTDGHGADFSLRKQSILISGSIVQVSKAYKTLCGTREAAENRSEPDVVKLRGDAGSRSDVKERINETNSTADTSNHFLILRIPEAQDGEVQPSRLVVGEKGATLAGIGRKFGVRFTRYASDIRKLKLVGADEGRLRRAKAYIQEIVHEACRRSNILPMSLHEVDRGPTSPPPGREPSRNRRESAPTNSASPVVANGDTAAHARKVALEDVKLGFSALTHPVVLVTSQVSNQLEHGRSADLLPFCRGVTVSSFNSVTLAPTPIISFNIRTPSRTWDALSSSGWLAAHVLIASPVGAALAHAFALPYERPDEPFWRARRLGAFVRVRGTAHGGSQTSPIITLGGAVLCTMRAMVDVRKSVKVGDHMIVVAEVKRIFYPSTKEGERGREIPLDAAALTYAKRGYRGMGEQLELATIPEAGSESWAPSAVDASRQEPLATDEDDETIQAQEEGADDRVGTPVAEAQSSAPEVSNAQTPEKTDMDYFEVIEDDDSEASSDPQPDQTMREEEEHDFGVALAGDGTSRQESQPLVEDSAAAQEEASVAPQRSDDGKHQWDEQAEDDDSTGTQKRPAVDSNVS